MGRCAADHGSEWSQIRKLKAEKYKVVLGQPFQMQEFQLVPLNQAYQNIHEKLTARSLKWLLHHRALNPEHLFYIEKNERKYMYIINHEKVKDGLITALETAEKNGAKIEY